MMQGHQELSACQFRNLQEACANSNWKNILR